MLRIPIVLLLFSVFLGYANNPEIDSLKVDLQRSTSAEQRIRIYRDIGKAHYQTQQHYDSAFYFAYKALELAQSESLLPEQAGAIFDQAAIFRAVGDVDKALAAYKKSIAISREVIKTDQRVARLLTASINNVGDVYVGKKDYGKAKKAFNEALKLAKDHGIIEIEAIEYLNLGEIYYYEGRLESSKASILRGQATYPAFEKTTAPFFFILARTYDALEENDNAEETALKGLALAKEQKDLKTALDLATLLSKFYVKQENFKEANVYQDMATAYSEILAAGASRSELEKLLLKLQLQKQESELEKLAQKNDYLTIIYVLGTIGTLLLIVLVFRQLKIVRMTKNIHDIQNSLIKSEMDIRDEKKISTFDAVVAGDTEFLGTEKPKKYL